MSLSNLPKQADVKIAKVYGEKNSGFLILHKAPFQKGSFSVHHSDYHELILFVLA